MLNLSQLKNKIFYCSCFLFLFVICSFSVYGFKLGVSPPEMSISIDANEEVCKEFTIYASNNGIEIRVYDLWSNDIDNVKVLDNYLLSSDELELNVKYDSLISVENQTNINLCISGKNGGTYEGAIFFESEEYGLSIGSFIHLKIIKSSMSGKKDNTFSSNSITGFSIFDGFNGLSKGLLLSFIFTFFCLVVLLFFLIELAKKRREKIV